MRAVVGADHVQGDTGIGDVERVVGGGGICDTDILPGSDDVYGICAAGGRDWRRDAVVAGDDDFGFGRIGVGIPPEPEGGFDVCDFAAGGAGVGGLQ